MSYVIDSDAEDTCLSAKSGEMAALAALFRPIFIRRQRSRFGGTLGIPLGILIFLVLLHSAGSSREAFLALGFFKILAVVIVVLGIGYYVGRYFGGLKGNMEAAEAQQKLFQLFDKEPGSKKLLVDMWDEEAHHERTAAKDLINLYNWNAEYEANYSLLR